MMIRRFFNIFLETAVENPTTQQTFIKNDTSNFSWLYSYAPCFPVSPNNIKIIYEPNQFYNTLLEYCKNASSRIFLVSLYLGTGDLETKLINALISNEHFRNKNLSINVLLDYIRGSRNEINSRHVLQPLLVENDEKCSVFLYHSPVLRGLLKKYMPNRYNELIGLQHMKLYIFDDTLIISGANLSNDYFTNRQDRYFIIKDRKLTDFYCGLIKKVQEFCLKMDKNNNVTFTSNWNCSPYEGDKKEFIKNAANLVETYLKKNIDKQNSVTNYEEFDTFIFPTFQMGQLEIEQDSLITEKLLAEVPIESKLRIATGYFNLTRQYMDTLIYKSRGNCEILMAHPTANGFLNAKGPAGGIPYAYSLIAYKFEQKCKQFKQLYRIKLLEYAREGWTYHGKGLWYYPPNEEHPSLTMVGSPNFGDRSVSKDLESQLVIVTENPNLREKLHQECENLYKLGSTADTQRKVPLWVNAFVTLFRSYF